MKTVLNIKYYFKQKQFVLLIKKIDLAAGKDHKTKC